MSVDFPELPKSNLNATTAPTASDDSNGGYAIGSTWINTAAAKAYICLDASVGAAVWTLTTKSADYTVDCGTAVSIYTGTGSIDCGGA